MLPLKLHNSFRVQYIDESDFHNVQIEDEGDPVKDINIHTLNMNLLRIGNM